MTKTSNWYSDVYVHDITGPLVVINAGVFGGVDSGPITDVMATVDIVVVSIKTTVPI